MKKSANFEKQQTQTPNSANENSKKIDDNEMLSAGLEEHKKNLKEQDLNIANYEKQLVQKQTLEDKSLQATDDTKVS